MGCPTGSSGREMDCWGKGLLHKMLTDVSASPALSCSQCPLLQVLASILVVVIWHYSYPSLLAVSIWCHDRSIHRPLLSPGYAYNSLTPSVLCVVYNNPQDLLDKCSHELQPTADTDAQGHWNVKIETELGVMYMKTKKCLKTPKNWKKQERIVSQRLQREVGLANALILDF